MYLLMKIRFVYLIHQTAQRLEQRREPVRNHYKFSCKPEVDYCYTTIRAQQFNGILSNFNLAGWIQYGGRGGRAEAERGRYRECP